MNTMEPITGRNTAKVLQALGFKDEAEYAEHQDMLARSAAMRQSNTLLVTEGPWCIVKHYRKLA